MSIPLFHVNLGRDLLWYIFLLNSDMEQELEDDIPAINTLRHSSQVCSTWRDVAVTSPSLWGHVVNFDRLQQGDWRSEVIRRTGGYRVCVRGHARHWRKGIENIVVSTVADLWPRIQTLTLDFRRTYSEDYEHDSDLWDLWKRPTDVLEFFQLSLVVTDGIDDDERPPILSPQNFKIFDNHAPSLRVFIAPNIKFDFQAPWISNIRRLALNSPVSVSKLLEALTWMPALETLENHSDVITLGEPNDSLQSLHEVALPSLRNITFTTTFNIKSSLTFLSHITPVDGRTLNFSNYPCDYYFDPTAQDILAVSRVLSTYSSQAKLAGCTDITLILMGTRFRFGATVGATTSFYFDMQCYKKFPRDATEDLFAALNHPDFPNVQKLKLRMEREDENFDSFYSNGRIAKFIASVGTVKILDTTPKTLDYLLHLPDEFLTEMFPAVQTITIEHPQMDQLPHVLAFLAFRTAVGNPIPTLYIKMGFGTLDLQYFDKVEGLKVIFGPYDGGANLKEYVCGGGRPKELIFERRH